MFSTTKKPSSKASKAKNAAEKTENNSDKDELKASSTKKEAPKKKATKKLSAVTTNASEDAVKIEQPEKKTKKVSKKEKEAEAKQEVELYTLKFNSPILPFAKFPLTQNKYIQDFLRRYEEDKSKIKKVIGVHFNNNNNANAIETVGIEIEITMRNNITVVESNSNKRYKIISYDELTNFCKAEEYQDVLDLPGGSGTDASGQQDGVITSKYKDLLMSELFELKNLWFMYNKKINSMLSILPQEILNRYDMVAKTLQPPVFDIAKYPTGTNFLDTFNEIVYKMAQYYFSVF